MNRRQMIAAAVTAPLVTAQSSRSLRDRLLGSWKLLTWVRVNPATNEITYPCGKNVTGRIMYDAGGRMAAQIMNVERPQSGSAGLDHLDYIRTISPQSAADFSAGYRAYFGSYDLDETKKAVTHHVQGDLDPIAVGRTRVRSVEFLTDDRIVLKYPYQGKEDVLTWERERP